MTDYDFDRIQAIGRKLREIFIRDRVRSMDGMEDYLVRAVEEAACDSEVCIGWNPIADRMPDDEANVLLRSKDGQYFIGTYKANGVFRVISRCELREGGGISQLTTGFHRSYFTHWAAIVPALRP